LFLAFLSYKDVEKLEKFMSRKPVAEQEIGNALLQEMWVTLKTQCPPENSYFHLFWEEFR